LSTCLPGAVRVSTATERLPRLTDMKYELSPALGSGLGLGLGLGLG